MVQQACAGWYLQPPPVLNGFVPFFNIQRAHQRQHHTHNFINGVSEYLHLSCSNAQRFSLIIFNIRNDL